MTDPTGDRVEAAARAVDKELADSATGPLYIAHLEFFPERASRGALAAADECDRVAGVVRVNTRDPETVERLAERVHEAWMTAKREMGVESRLSESGEELVAPYSLLSEPAKELDRSTVRAVVAALAAAGAQPPPKEDDQR
jgi:hypothetical protein